MTGDIEIIKFKYEDWKHQKFKMIEYGGLKVSKLLNMGGLKVSKLLNMKDWRYRNN